jgi:hypothetical protein
LSVRAGIDATQNILVVSPGRLISGAERLEFRVLALDMAYPSISMQFSRESPSGRCLSSRKSQQLTMDAHVRHVSPAATSPSTWRGCELGVNGKDNQRKRQRATGNSCLHVRFQEVRIMNLVTPSDHRSRLVQPGFIRGFNRVLTPNHAAYVKHTPQLPYLRSKQHEKSCQLSL